MLQKIADAVEARVEELARTVAEETGNAIRTQARPEVKSAVDIFRYFGGVASELKGETIPLGEHVLSYTRREPIGVVGAIVPWNAPVVLGTLKIAMAVAAGNTLVLKAAEDAPLGLLRVAHLCNEHLPKGVRQPADRLRRGMRRRARRAIRSCASCRSPAPPRSASSSCTRRPTASCRCRSSSAARAPPSSFRMPTRRARSTASSRDALHAPGPVVHGRLAPVPARSIFDSFLGKLADKTREAEDRRSAR